MSENQKKQKRPSHGERWISDAYRLMAGDLRPKPSTPPPAPEQAESPPLSADDLRSLVGQG